MAVLITSLQNPTIKHLVKLRQRRERDRHQLMLIDGARALRLALHNAWPISVSDTLDICAASVSEGLSTR
jgi:hypothetical protein